MSKTAPKEDVKTTRSTDGIFFTELEDRLYSFDGRDNDVLLETRDSCSGKDRLKKKHASATRKLNGSSHVSELTQQRG